MNEFPYLTDVRCWENNPIGEKHWENSTSLKLNDFDVLDNSAKCDKFFTTTSAILDGSRINFFFFFLLNKIDQEQYCLHTSAKK